MNTTGHLTGDFMSKYNSNIDFDYIDWSTNAIESDLSKITNSIKYSSRLQHTQISKIVQLESDYKSEIDDLKSTGKSRVNAVSSKLISTSSKIATNLHEHGDDLNAGRLASLIAHIQTAQSIFNKDKKFKSAQYITSKNYIKTQHTWTEGEAYKKRVDLSNFQALFVMNVGGVKDTSMKNLSDTGDILVKPPYMLIFLGQYLKVGNAINASLETIVKGMNDSSGLLNQGASQLGASFGDLKAGPLHAIIEVMSGYITMTSYAINIGATVTDATSSGLDKISKAYKKKGGAEKAEDASNTFMKSLGTTMELIANSLSGITSLISSMFQLGFTLFISLLTSIMKIMKSIAETSKVLEGILSYIELVCSLFFVTFFIVFGTPIMNAITSMISIMITTGVQLGINYRSQLKSDEAFNDAMSNIVDELEELATKFLKDFLPVFVPLVKPFLEFVLGFIEVILNNKDLIFQMLSKGISAFTTMIKENLIVNLIDYGTAFFTWMSKNSETVTNCVNFLLSLCKLCLQAVGIFISDIELWTFALLVGIGTAAGAIAGAIAGAMSSWFTFGASIPVCIAVGAATGAIAGAAAYWVIYDQVFKGLEGFQYEAFANGGKISPSVGGIVGLISEAGEGEYIVPESKLSQFRGCNNIIIRCKGKVYNKEVIEKLVEDLDLDSSYSYVFQ